MIEIKGGVQVITSGGAVIVELANEGPQGPSGGGGTGNTYFPGGW